MKVKFDCILGRIRECCGQGGGGDTPDPAPHFTVNTSPNADVRYEADLETNPGLTVVVTTLFDGVTVDADSVPDGWSRIARGTYRKTLAAPGTVAAQAWSYTPGGIYLEQTVTKYSAARSLVAIWPAYWGVYPSSDADGDITAVVASLAEQHRLTANLPQTTLEIPNPTANDCYMWIVTRGSATATPQAFDISMLRDPVTGKTFTSPLSSLSMSGYKAYVSINPAGAGLSFGNVKLTINI